MASSSSQDGDKVSITVDMSSKGADNKASLNDIPSSMTVGELKTKLNVPVNARLGRADKFENWDNRRKLSDYFVKSGEHFDCVIQCSVEDTQRKFDDYDEWLAAHKAK